MADTRPDRVRAGGAARPGADVLTFLIADMRGYTRFTNEHGDRAAAELAARFAEVARECVEARAGSVIELRGDEVLAVFDSARQAIRSAVELQQAIGLEIEPGMADSLPIGIGLDAGEAIPVEGGYRGEALNLAARLCSLARPGEIVASAGVVHLARSIDGIAYEEMGSTELKGIGRATEAIRIVSAAPSRPAVTPRIALSELPPELDEQTGQIRGRERELWWLRGSWRLAQHGNGRVLFLRGPEGSGKTRLAAELARTVAAQGADIWYVGFRGDGSATGEVLAEMARATAPALVVLDDIDASGGAGLAALERVAELAASRPILALVTYSDDLADPRLAAAAARLDPNGDARRTLEPLSTEDIAAIAAPYAGEDVARLPLAAIVEASGGRPGMVHELASEWASNEASRRLGAIAGRTASGRRDLQAMEAELASNIIDLQRVRERSRQARSPSASRLATQAASICPFKGLAPFETGDAGFYFGRERLVAELVARLVGGTFLAIVGPSGSGKSSAMRAGLLPALTSGVLPGSGTWTQRVMRPGDHPVASLRRALGVSAAGTGQGEHDVLDAALAALAVGSRLVISVDQFEEVFTQAADDEREEFIDLLTRAANDPEHRVLVLIAIRADFYGRCAAHAGLAELMGSSHVLVGPMRADEFARAIELPAEAAGLRVEPELTAALVTDVLDEPGGLPLLSTALLELWQKRDGRTLRMASYQETGGVRGAVARLAEQAYGRLEPDQQTIARGILLRLAVSNEGAAVVRRRAPLSEFDAAENPNVARVLSVLADSRLLTVSEGTVEVAHEALLREWPRLAGWIEEDAEGRRLRSHLIDAAKEWQASNRDAGELYRGARLATALDWTTEHTLELNDLERAFLNDSRAATEREADRTRRTNRRLRGLLAVAVGFLIVAVVAGLFAFVQQGEAQRAAQTAEAERAEAERSALKADAQRLGAQALTEDDLDVSLLLARQAVALEDSVETRGTLLAALLRAPGAIHVMHGTGDRTNWIDISPDGKVVVAGDHLGAVVFIDAVTFEQLGEMRINAGFGHAFSPDSQTLAISGGSFEYEQIMLIDVATRTIRATHRLAPDRYGVDLLAFSNDGALLGVVEGIPDGDPDVPDLHVLSVVDPRSPAGAGTEMALGGGDPCAFESFGETDFAYSACIDPRGRTDLLDVTNRTVTASFPVGGNAAVSPDGSQLAVAPFDNSGSVTFIDVGTGDEHAAPGGHESNIQGMGFAPDGKSLVTLGDDRDVIVWDVDSFRVRERLHGHSGRVFGPAFTPDSKTVFTASLDGTIFAWDLAGDRRLGRAFSVGSAPEPDRTQTLDLSPDNTTLAVGLKDGVVRLIDLSGAVAPRDISTWGIEDHQAWLDKYPDAGWKDPALHVASLGFSPDGRTLAVGTNIPPLVLIDVATGDVTRFETGHNFGWINAIAWSSDGASVATAGDDGIVRFWDPRTQSQTKVVHAYARAPDQPDPWILSTALTKAGATLAVARSDGVVQIMDVGGDRELRRIQADLFGTFTVRFSPDERTIATTGTQSGDITFWDVATGARVGEPLDAHDGFALDEIFTPTGSFLASSGTDGIARLWDVASQRAYGTPLHSSAQGDSNQWVQMAMSSDGRTLYELYLFSGNVVAWSLDPAVWAQRACEVAGRNLTEAEWNAFLPGRPYAPGCTAQTPLARQVHLTLTAEVPDTTDGSGKSVHVAGLLDRLDGAYSKWDPAGAPLTRVDATHWRIELSGAEGTRIDYVYTLGSWDTEGGDTACGPDYTVTLDYGTDGAQNIADVVPNWNGKSACGQ